MELCLHVGPIDRLLGERERLISLLAHFHNSPMVRPLAVAAPSEIRSPSNSKTKSHPEFHSGDGFRI